jgi:GR25 family glycosyltransferase involved in LPS biosynthesis
MILIGIIILVLILMVYVFNIKQESFTNWENDIDAYIYINMDKREDRKKLLLEEFDKINIPKNKIYRIAGVPIPKNGHKGCVQSHILALEMAKLNKWNTVAIFEDDFQLNVSPDEFIRLVDKAINYPKWDVIILHGAGQEEKKKIDEDVYYLNHSSQSTGYIIKREYIDKLLDLFKMCNSHMSPDHWGNGKERWESYALDQQWIKLMKEDNWIGLRPNVGKQRAIESSIMSDS